MYGCITIDRMKATQIFHEKRIVESRLTDELAIVELKIWKIPKSRHYQLGRRFSLFLVVEGRAVLGIDNHSPKGPHLHLGAEEMVYDYQDDQNLLEDFWGLVRKAGFDP